MDTHSIRLSLPSSGGRRKRTKLVLNFFTPPSLSLLWVMKCSACCAIVASRLILVGEHAVGP